jgi:hypothetical protein
MIQKKANRKGAKVTQRLRKEMPFFAALLCAFAPLRLELGFSE